jgi:hypothetical protein
MVHVICNQGNENQNHSDAEDVAQG